MFMLGVAPLKNGTEAVNILDPQMWLTDRRLPVILVPSKLVKKRERGKGWSDAGMITAS